MKRFILFFFLVFLMGHYKSQTIIMNEVSNGPTGSQEYVEFVVVSNSVSYNCNNTAPPCIDIRGWIFDDNSGLHGGTSGTGVASGAIRFSQNPIWQCIPLGTIILIYNNLDKNPAIPADDISMSDGNCRIIAPVNSPNLFETNSTTPGAVACSYPGSGWTAVGTWSTTLLANTGDCARIVNLAGCEVFSVCYGTANTNNLIYFAGSGGQSVFYFNGVNPMVQANWSVGSASVNQTPGSPNNAANASFISQFNNGCMPITPIALGTPTVVGSSGCGCNGSASVNPNGSIGPYTYEWYDSTPISIGQTASTATALCSGVYKVVVTSHIGCKDSAFVTINSSSGPSVTVNSQTICSGASAILTATPSSAGGTYLWSPGGQTTQTISVNPSNTTTYSVTYSVTGCSVTNSAVVSVNSSPAIIISSSSPSLCVSGQTATLSLSGSSGTYTWSNGGIGASTIVNTPGVYTATVNTANCGNAQSSITINTIPVPTVMLNPSSVSLCAGQTATVQTIVNTAVSYSWSTGATTNSIVVNSTGVETVSVSNTCGFSTASLNIQTGVAPVISLTSSTATICPNKTAVLTVTGGTAPYVWSNSSNTGSVVTTNGGTITVSNSNGCGTATASVVVNVDSLNADITADPTSGTSPLEVSFYNNSVNATSYSWNFGNGSVASTQTVTSQVYNNTGVYVIYLTITNGVCFDKDSLTITVLEDGPTLYVPNAFTPNGDRINDVFWIGATNIKEFHIIIFDRWGLKLFESSEIEKSWDGKISGKEVSDGCYFYLIKAKGTDNSDLKKQGTVTLFK